MTDRIREQIEFMANHRRYTILPGTAGGIADSLEALLEVYEAIKPFGAAHNSSDPYARITLHDLRMAREAIAKVEEL